MHALCKWAPLGALFVAVTAASVVPASAQVPVAIRTFGGPVAPMFEGWYQNPDGTATILVGFFNSNREEGIDVPVGEENLFSPGEPDRGQPTHFPPGRAWGVLTLRVPGDFDGELSWTITANGQPATIPVHLEAPYFVEPFRDAADGNEPPTIWFAEDGARFTGPPVGVAHEVTGQVGEPVDLSAWTSDVKPETSHAPGGFRRPALTLRWHLHRAPAGGMMEFDEPVHRFRESADQNPTTMATFTAPGEYLLRAEVLDETGVGGGGFQCCWTSAIVRVTVTP